MNNLSRRAFLIHGSLAVAALGTGCTKIAADTKPTESSGDMGAYGRYLEEVEPVAVQPAQPPGAPEGDWTPTEDNILGPFHRPGAPFRGKVTPPLEPGLPLLIRGQVFGKDTRAPLSGAVLDIWQANARGRYDNDDPAKPPAKDVFVNRTRLTTDELGRYEFETIHPGPYRIGPRAWRPPHIHFIVRHPGHKTLVTQLYFRGDPHQADDAFIKDSLIIDLADVPVGADAYKSGAFRIVLAAGN